MTKILCSDGSWLTINNPSQNAVKFKRQCWIITHKCSKELAVPFRVYESFDSVDSVKAEKPKQEETETKYEQLTFRF